MFAIYGITGPVFQGTLESLSRIPPVERRRAISGVRPFNAEERRDTPAYAPTTNHLPGHTAIDAYQAMLPKNLERGPLYYANQIMRKEVITLRAADTLSHAWQILFEQQIHQAPVLDADLHLVGIFSDRNLLSAFRGSPQNMQITQQSLVKDAMTTPVVTASPLTDIRHIVRVMLERNVEGVPILSESGNLLGFISRSDILSAVVAEPPLSTWR